MAYLFLGYEKNSYTDRNGVDRERFNLFIAEPVRYGYKPISRYNSSARASFPYSVTTDFFNEHRLGDVAKYPIAIKGLTFDRYGNISDIIFQ